MERTASAGRLGGRVGFLHLLEGWLRSVEERRAVARLERLDDHALRDIGLTRMDIRRAVHSGRR